MVQAESLYQFVCRAHGRKKTRSGAVWLHYTRPSSYLRYLFILRGALLCMKFVWRCSSLRCDHSIQYPLFHPVTLMVHVFIIFYFSFDTQRIWILLPQPFHKKMIQRCSNVASFSFRRCVRDDSKMIECWFPLIGIKKGESFQTLLNCAITISTAHSGAKLL